MAHNNRTDGKFFTNFTVSTPELLKKHVEIYVSISLDLGVKLTLSTTSLDIMGINYPGACSAYVSGGNSGLTDEEALKRVWDELRKRRNI